LCTCPVHQSHALGLLACAACSRLADTARAARLLGAEGIAAAIRATIGSLAQRANLLDLLLHPSALEAAPALAPDAEGSLINAPDAVRRGGAALLLPGAPPTPRPPRVVVLQAGFSPLDAGAGDLAAASLRDLSMLRWYMYCQVRCCVYSARCAGYMHCLAHTAARHVLYVLSMLCYYVYCQMHGYEYRRIVDERPSWNGTEKYSFWDKPRAILDVLRQLSDGDLLAFVDFDVYLTDLRLPLTALLARWGFVGPAQLVLQAQDPDTPRNYVVDSRGVRLRMVNTGFTVYRK
jgi:hypothetical protein